MRRKAGFTLVEVMIAIGIMTIGGMAILAMQQQTTRANMHARQLTIAMQIAQNVLERMKLEGVTWTNAGNPGVDLQNALSLNAINTTAGAFMPLQERAYTSGVATRTLSNAFDFYGDDVALTNATPATQATVVYCASYRLSWVFTGARLMRVDTRVWWSKDSPGRTILSDFAGCADDNAALNPTGALFENYHIVYLSTVLRAH